MFNRRFGAWLVLLVLLLVTLQPAALAATPKIRKTEFEGNGIIDVDFKKDVQYKNVRVKVKDSSGKSCTVKIVDKDEDSISFYVKNLLPGKKYTYTISGVRAGKSGSYKSVKGSFTTPTVALAIKDIDYDRSDGELDIDFVARVQYKNAAVIIVNAAGEQKAAKILKKKSDEIKVSVKGLTYGETYGVIVSGVRLKGTSGSYGNVTGTFKAVDN